MADERFRIIFEGKGDLDPVLRKIEDALDGLKRNNPFDALNKSIEQNQKSLDMLSTSFSDAFGSVVKAVESLNETLGKIPVEQANRLVDGLEKVTEETVRVREETEKNILTMGRFAQAVSGIAGGAARAFSAAGTQIRGLAEGVGSAFGGALSGIGGSLGGIGAGDLSGNLFSPLLDGARNALNVVLEGANSVVQGVLSAAQSVVGSVGNLLGELQRTVGTAVGGILGAITGLGSIPGALVGSAVGSLSKAITDVKTGLLQGALSIASGVADLVAGALSAGVNVAAQILNGLVTVAQNVVEGIARAFGGLVSKISAIAGDVAGKVALALTGIGGVAAAQAVKFRDEMAIAWALVPEMGKEAFEELTREMERFLADVPKISPAEGARGLQEVFSADIKEPTAALETLRAATTLAAAGGMKELRSPVEAITRLMDNFGVSAMDAADAIFRIKDVAKVEVGDITQGIGVTIEPAVRAGVSLEELGAMITFVSKTLPPAETFTAVARAISTLIAPTDDSKKAFEEFGIQLRDSQGNLRPLFDIVDQIRRSGARDFDIARMFPNERAIRAIGLAVEATKEKLDELVAGMGDRFGVAGKAAERATSSLGATFSDVWNSITTTASRFIGIVEGELISALKSLDKVLNEIRESPIFEAMAKSVGEALSAVVGFVRDGILWLRDNHEELKRKIVEAWEGIKRALTIAGGVIDTTLKLVTDHVKTNPEGELATAWEKVKAASAAALDVIRAYAAGDVAPLAAAFDRLWHQIEGRAGLMWSNIKAFGLDAVSELLAELGNILPRGVQRLSEEFPGFTKLLGLAGFEVPGVDLVSDAKNAQKDVAHIRGEISGAGTGENVNRILNEVFFSDAVSDRVRRFSPTGRLPSGTRSEVEELLGSIEAEIDRQLRELNIFAPISSALADAADEARKEHSEREQAFAARAVELGQAYDRTVEAWKKRAREAAEAAALPEDVFDGVSDRIRGSQGADVLGPLGLAGARGVVGIPGPLLGGDATDSSALAPFPTSKPLDAETAARAAAAIVERMSIPGLAGSPFAGAAAGPGSGSRVTAERLPFGLGFPAQGLPVTGRTIEDVERQFEEHRRIMASLDEEMRKAVKAILPEHYSLNQLREAVRFAEENQLRFIEPDVPSERELEKMRAGKERPLNLAEQEAKGFLSEDRSDPFGPDPETSFGPFGPPSGLSLGQAQSPGRVGEEEAGGADASPAAAAVAAAEQAAAEAAAEREQIAADHEALAGALQEFSEVSREAKDEHSDLYRTLIELVRNEIGQLRKQMQEDRNRKADAQRQFAGAGGR